MFEEEIEIALPAEILESLEDMTCELQELRSLVLSLALNANQLPAHLPAAPADSSH